MVSAVRLNTLLDDLDRAGLDAGPSARQHAHMLYMLLASDQSLDDPNAERRLVDHLRPLIIRSREQSAAFERVVTQWGVSAPANSVANTASGGPKSADVATPSALPKAPRSFPIPLPWLIGALATLALIFWGLSRITEPTPVVIPDEIEPVDPIPEIAPDITPIVEDRELEFVPPTPSEADIEVMDGEVFELLLSSHLVRYEFAPTLRELHAIEFFGETPLADLRRLTGFAPDRPLPINETVLKRLFAAAFLQGEASDDMWRALSQPNSMVESSWPMETSDRVEIIRNLNSVGADLLGSFGIRAPSQTEQTRAEESADLFDGIEELAKPYGEIETLYSMTDSNIMSVTTSRDGELVIAGLASGSMTIWSNTTQEFVRPNDRHTTQIWSVELSPDDTFIVSASMDATAKVWDAQTGEISVDLSGHESEVTHATFSRSGDLIATTSNDGTARLWSVETGETILTVNHGEPGIWFADFSPNDEEFLTAGKDGFIRFWNTQTGELIDEWGVSAGEVNTARYSNDGTRILSGNATQAPFILERETGRPIRTFIGHPDNTVTAFFSSDDSMVVTTSNDPSVRLWDAETGELISQIGSYLQAVTWAEFTADDSKIISSGYQGNNRSTETAILLIPKNADDLWPAKQSRVWTTEALAEATRESLNRRFDVTLPDEITDAQIVRQVAALAYQRGDTLLLRDPPWNTERWHGMHEAHVVQRNAPLFAALVILLAGIGAWLWSAFNMRAYLQRRRPGDPGRVIELFSDTRHQADKVQNAIRRAAKALLQRQPGHERLDIKASIKATAKARGLFTPVEKRDTRMPEYLFLIDARSRADHETQRTLDYLDRLRKEHVPITHYFYERAPDRVRASMGAPSQSLDLIASEHSDKRLVLVGDAASMYASNRSGSGAWKKTLESWQSKSFVTTVPAAEWGVEEEKFTQETGLVANVLSAEGLEALPTALFAEGMVGQVPANPVGELDVPPLPSMMRRDPERWVLESPPDEDEWLDLQTALIGYLGIPGWRWLSACAVYPVIEWDLTVALGQVLKGADKDPLFTESRAARLSELPWMRAGEMPDWLRARLIDEIDYIDREAVRDLIAKILEAVDSEQKSGGDSISLKFGYLQGREPDSDERFVDFVTRAPESMDQNALLATRKLRELLRPNILTRLIDPGALGWLVIGVAASIIAWLVAPRYIGAPSHTGAWAPLFAMLVGPIVAWFLWRQGKKAWSARPQDGSSLAESSSRAGGYLLTWLSSFIGLAGITANRMRDASPMVADGAAKLLRRRVEVWCMVPMIFVSSLLAIFGFTFVGIIWGALFSPIANWIAPLRNSLVGDLVLTALLGVALYYGARLVWHFTSRLYGITVRIADRASLRRQDLAHQPGGRISRSVFVSVALFVSVAIAMLSLIFLSILSPAIQATFESSVAFNLWVLFAVMSVMLGVPAWHIWTLRRTAEALERRDAKRETARPEMKAAA